MKSSKLRELIAKATPGRVYLTNTWLSVGDGMHPIANFNFGGAKKADKDLIAYLRNNAEAIAELIEAAEELAKGMNQFSHGRSKEEDKLLAALAKIKEQP